MLSTAKAFIFDYLLRVVKVRVADWFVRQKLFKKIVLKILPLMRFSNRLTQMNGRAYHDGYDRLRPGDIVLTKDNSRLSTWIIGGYWAHAGLCVSKDMDFECAEMTHEHYTESTFADMCFKADEVAIVRMKSWSEDYIRKTIIPNVKSFKGSKYDYMFNLKNDYLSCSEMIYKADTLKKGKFNKEDIAGLGREYISPTGLYNSVEAEVIWRSSWSI